MSLIPQGISKVEFQGPRRLLIYSVPKTGKTEAVLQLEDHMLLDLEGGASGFYEGRIAKATTWPELAGLMKEMKETDFHVKYLVIDTVTKLEELAKSYAATIYKTTTSMGKNYDTKKDITTLPNGAGYLYLRKAVVTLLNKLQEYCDYLILLGHVKYTDLSTESEEVLVRELSLTGKLKDIVVAESDAIGYLRPDKTDPNKRVLSFKASNNLIAGARPAHLSNKEIIISEKQEDGSLTTNWKLIYPD